MSIKSICEIAAHNRKEGQRCYLETEASEHYIYANLISCLCISSGGYTTTSCLEDQREYITTAEYQCVGARVKPREVLAIHDDNAAEAEVYSGREECRSDSQAAEVNDEVISGRVERIVVEQDAGNVAYDFADEANAHGRHITPGLVPDAQVKVDENIDRKYGSKKGVACQIRDIVEVRKCQIADVDVAEDVGVKEDGEVPIRCVVVPIPTGKAVCRNE